MNAIDRNMSSLDNVNSCGTTEIVIFILSVIFGTACHVLAKALMSMTVTDEHVRGHAVGTSNALGCDNLQTQLSRV